MSIYEHALRVFDCAEVGILPPDWTDQVYRTSDRFSILVHLDGDSKDSREAAGSTGIDYYVVTGDIVARELPWLYNLYTSRFLDLASQASGVRLEPAINIRQGININTLRGQGARYEWHVDPNPVTGILFADSLDQEDGGELLIDRPVGKVTFRPRKGSFLAFGAQVPHSVAPLKVGKTRISIPMIYYINGQIQEWNSDLDSYLYGRR